MDLGIVLKATAENPNVGDLELIDGDAYFTDDIRATIQDIFIRLRFWYGEWFRDTRLGIPYRERVLVKNPDIDAISAMLRKVVLDVPGMGSIDTFQVVHDRVARTLTVTFKGRSSSGIAFTSADFGELVVPI